RSAVAVDPIGETTNEPGQPFAPAGCCLASLVYAERALPLRLVDSREYLLLARECLTVSPLISLYQPFPPVRLCGFYRIFCLISTAGRCSVRRTWLEKLCLAVTVRPLPSSRSAQRRTLQARRSRQLE